MHFKISEIHKQRVNSVLYISHNYKQLLLYKYLASYVSLSLSEWLLKSPETICYSNFTMVKAEYNEHYSSKVWG